MKKHSFGSVIAPLLFGLAGGVALGSFVIVPLVSSSDANNDKSTVVTQDGDVEAGQALTELNAANNLVKNTSASIVGESLKDRPVLIMAEEGAETAGVVKDLSPLLEQAGAPSSGVITIKDKFFSEEGADNLKSIIATTLPAGAELSTENQTAGMHAGEALSSALMFGKDSQPLASTEDRGLILQGLRDAGYIDYEDKTIRPAQSILFVMADQAENDTFRSNSEKDFVLGLASKESGIVASGPLSLTAVDGPLGLLRETPEKNFSTVDSIDNEWARIVALLTIRYELDGKSGAFGAADNATAVSP